MARKTPDRVTTHPGEILSAEFLEPHGLSANALAIDRYPEEQSRSESQKDTEFRL